MQPTERHLLTRELHIEWEFASIDVGYGSAGFYFNETGLQFDPEESDFHGWLGKCNFPPCQFLHGLGAMVFIENNG